MKRSSHFGLFFGFFGLCGVFSVFGIAGNTTLARADSIGFSVSDNTPTTGQTQLNVTVLDDQTLVPISGASVSVTDGLAFGPASERMHADIAGQARFRDDSPVPKIVTVSKDGYATLSVVGIEGTDFTAYLKPLQSPQQSSQTAATAVASGTITDWDGVSTDSSVVHAGIVFRTSGAADLLNFQISNYISPLKDTLDLGGIAGKHQIPSNLVLPDQTLSYLFFNIEVNHPTYRLPVPTGQALGLTGMEIEADVSDVVSMSNGFNLDLLNNVRFKRAGMTPTFTASQDFTQDVNASYALVATHQASITQAPSFTSDVLAVAFSDVNGDKSALLPSDLKVIYNHNDGGDPSDATQTQVALSAPQGIPASELAVATVAVGTQGELAGILNEPAGATVQAGAFLNTDTLPQDQTALPATVTVHTPAQGMGAAIFVTTQPVWYVYTLPVAGDVQVPTAKLSAATAVTSYSVNQVEFSQFNPNAIDGTKILSFLQRFARSSAKIKASAVAPRL